MSLTIGCGRYAALLAATALLAGCGSLDLNRIVAEMTSDWCRSASNCDVYSADQRYGPPALDRGL